MKIFDCFKFFNEVELLHLRLLEYSNIVDYFVIVEANKTHTGKPKEYLFPQLVDKFQKYLPKIIYVQVDDLPDYHPDHIWVPENYQRNAIMRGLVNVAEPGDKIIVSDCDELWSVDALFDHINDDRWLCFQQELFYYWVNCKQQQLWSGSVVANYGTFGCPQDLRNYARFSNPILIPNGGWHYSFMGGPDRIYEKVQNIAESKYIVNEVGDIDQISQRMENVEDLWGRTDDYAQKQIVSLEHTPHKLDEFLYYYPWFIKQ